LNSGYGAELIPDRTDGWVKSSGLSPKKRESWWGFNTDFAASLLSFSKLAHTHDFDNHSDGYRRSKQHSCRALADCRKSDSSTALKLGFFSEMMRVMIFNIVKFFIGLGSLMICTHDLTVLTKTKEMTRYCESFRYGGKDALGKHFYRFNGVCVPA
jgi:hypothetical protein